MSAVWSTSLSLEFVRQKGKRVRANDPGLDLTLGVGSALFARLQEAAPRSVRNDKGEITLFRIEEEGVALQLRARMLNRA
jgi:hypothetical protein